ncbi:MAG: hypothetical protein QOG30_881 [Acidimicrobiaceae bacterium]
MRPAHVLAVVLVALTACGGSPQTKADQGRSIAEQAGLAPDVATFFSLTASGANATYRETIETADSAGKPVQVTTTQRPPDTRVDVFHADGTIDSTIAVGGRSYQCTMAASRWDCGELGASPSSGAQVFDTKAVQNAIATFRQRVNEYDFRVEDRPMVGVTARCLVTTRKPGREQDPSLGASATLCVSPEGAVMLVDVPAGSTKATAYSTTIPSDAFTLPAPVTAASSAAPTTAN